MTSNYDPSGCLVEWLDAQADNGDTNSEAITFLFDGLGRPRGVISRVGTESIVTRDPDGNVTARLLRGRPGGPSPTDNSTAGNVDLAFHQYHHDERGWLYQADAALFSPAGVTFARPP